MKIRTDHLLHALASFAIAVIIAAILSACGVTTASVWGVGIALLCGGAKELYDLISKKGTAEFSDFVADLLGCIAAIVVAMLLRI